jgi:hypothetical protein
LSARQGARNGGVRVKERDSEVEEEGSRRNSMSGEGREREARKVGEGGDDSVPQDGPQQ